MLPPNFYHVALIDARPRPPRHWGKGWHKTVSLVSCSLVEIGTVCGDLFGDLCLVTGVCDYFDTRISFVTGHVLLTVACLIEGWLWDRLLNYQKSCPTCLPYSIGHGIS